MVYGLIKPGFHWPRKHKRFVSSENSLLDAKVLKSHKVDVEVETEPHKHMHDAGTKIHWFLVPSYNAVLRVESGTGLFHWTKITACVVLALRPVFT